MSCGSVLMQIALSCYLLLHVAVFKATSGHAAAQPFIDHQAINQAELPGDFLKFVKELDTIVFNNDGKRASEVLKRSTLNQFQTQITTQRPRITKRSDDKLKTQKDTLRDVLMMKLVSYYEDKYKLFQDNDRQPTAHDIKHRTTHGKKYSILQTNENKYIIPPAIEDKHKNSHGTQNRYKNTPSYGEMYRFLHGNENKYVTNEEKHRISRDDENKYDKHTDKYRRINDNANKHEKSYRISQYNDNKYTRGEGNYRISEDIGNKHAKKNDNYRIPAHDQDNSNPPNNEKKHIVSFDNEDKVTLPYNRNNYRITSVNLNTNVDTYKLSDDNEQKSFFHNGDDLRMLNGGEDKIKHSFDSEKKCNDDSYNNQNKHNICNDNEHKYRPSFDLQDVFASAATNVHQGVEVLIDDTNTNTRKRIDYPIITYPTPTTETPLEEVVIL